MRKADNDLQTGKNELSRDDPITDTVCFHMQQCCEKYLKSFLIFHGKEVPRVHSLAALIERCADIDADFRRLNELDIDHLTDYAVTIRYGDEFYMPSVEEARQALQIAERVREFVLAKLAQSGLEV
ncbi:MAG: HEPN domain-containing protein [Armatimonadota bacterium]